VCPVHLRAFFAEEAAGLARERETMHRLQGVAVQLLQQAQKTTLVAQGLCCLVVFFYLLGFAPRVAENVAVTPAYIMPPNVKVWTLVTATFFERRIVYVVLDVLALIGFSAVLQPFWTAREFAIFSAVVSVSCLVSGVGVSILLYALSQSVSFLFVYYHGMIGLVCGYVVAVKQYHPDSVPFPPPTPPTLRVKHVPLTVATVFLVLSLCGVISYASLWLVLNGISSSWIYLRFFQRNQQGSRGDMSESFSFASFFPEPIQPALARLGGFIYHILVSVKVCPKIEMTYDVGAPSQINLTLPGTDRVDAQRRKSVDNKQHHYNDSHKWPSEYRTPSPL
jgi:hypothetical protein